MEQSAEALSYRDWTARMDRMEQGQMAIQADIAALTANVNTMVQNQTRQQGEIAELRSQDRDRRNTPWGTLITGVVAVLGVGAMALAPLQFRMATMESEFESHRDRVGHPQLVERVDGLARHLDESMAGLRREAQLRADNTRLRALIQEAD
jgi:hypothetical protein